MSLSSFFSRKSLLLLVVVLVVIVLMIIMPYNDYAVLRLRAFAKDIPREADSMAVEQRQQEWYGTGYVAAKKIQSAIEGSHFSGEPLILLQPNTYFRANKMNITMPEPAVFYNYTGLHTIWTNSNMVQMATHVVEITPKGMRILVVHKDTRVIYAFLERYAAYDVAL